MPAVNRPSYFDSTDDNAKVHDLNSVHYKMSKKIAQLTKVVYMLNTKNEDGETALEEVGKMHATEMERLKMDNRIKLLHYQEMVDEGIEYRSKIADLEAKLAHSVSVANNEKQEYERQLTKAKQSTNEMKEAYEQQIRQLKDMLREFEEDSERGSKATHEILQKWNEHKCPNVEQIIAEKEQKQRQLDEAYESQKQLEKKLKDIKLDLSAAYEDELNRMSAELEAKIDASKEQENEVQSLLQIIKRMEQAQKDTNEFNQTKEIRIREESVSETTERLTQQWEQKVKDMKSTYEETAIREQQLTDQIKQKLLDELLVTRTRLEECEKSQITQKLQSESALNATQTELSALRGRLQKLDEALCSEQRLKETLIQKHKKEAHRLREECSELKSKIRLVENQLASVKNTQLENTEKTTAEKVKKLQNQNADLELRLTVMQNEINTCKTQWEYQKRRWCDGVVRLKEDLNVLLRTFSMIKENVSWEIKQLVKEVFRIKKNTGDHIQTLITSYHERMMETIRKDSENQERKSQVGKHRVELENIRYRKLAESLRQEKEAQRLEFTKKNDELQKEISSLEETYKKSLKCSESAWQKAQSSAAEMQARLDETQSKLTETTHEVDQLKKKCECLQKRVKMEKSCRFTDLAAELDRKWAETMGRECARVRDETTSKMEAELSIKLESKEIALRMEKTKLDWEYREMVVALEAELERVKSSEARLRDIVSKYEVMLSQHQNQTFTDIKNEAEKAEDAWEKRSNKSSRITTPVRDSGKVCTRDSLEVSGCSESPEFYNAATQTDVSNPRDDEAQRSSIEMLEDRLRDAQEKMSETVVMLEQKSHACQLLEEVLGRTEAKLTSQLESQNEALSKHIAREKALEEELKLTRLKLQSDFDQKLSALEEEQKKALSCQQEGFAVAQNLLKAKIHELHQRLTRLNAGNCELPQIEPAKKLVFPRLANTGFTLNVNERPERRNCTGIPQIGSDIGRGHSPQACFKPSWLSTTCT